MYNSEAVVIHSHDYKFKELFKDTSTKVFLKDNDYLMKYNATGSAKDLLLFIIRSLKKNIKAISNIVPTCNKILGNKLVKIIKSYQENIKKFSASRFY